MKPVSPFHARGLRALRLMILTLATGLALASCGGGVGTGGTGSFGSAFVAGPITGFGSVIVNDVRFDDSTARVEDVDGNVRGRDELRLGMTVEVDGSPIVTTSSGSVATASRVRITSELLGPISALDPASDTLRLLGQLVAVDANTVFDESMVGGMAALAPGQLVEVYGVWDASAARYRATRIEARASAATYGLRGVVTALDGNQRTLVVGGATLAYSAAAGIPADLVVGRYVRVRLQPANPGSLRWNVASFGDAIARPPEQASVKIKGMINSISSVTNFSVDGRPVNAAGADFPDGSALAPGVRVEVEGTWAGGVLQATKVAIESEQGMHQHGFDLRGQIASVNPAARTFVLRGYTVSWARNDLRLDGGTLADIVAGRQVEVRAMLSPGGVQLEATRIKFD